MSESMGVVTVVARRPSSLPTQIPTTIEGVSGETVARTVNATDAEDALKYLPSLNVRKRYVGDFDHAVLASRASGTQNSARSLVYADGILLSNLLGNGASFTPRWGLVTPEEIERVDVLYGPFSAAYPGNSVGAVVDYVTRMPESLELRASVSTFVEGFDVYETHDDFGGWQASATYGDVHGDSSWWLNFNRLDSDSHPIAYATRLLSQGVAGTAGTPVTGALAARNPRNQDWWLLGATNRIETVQDHAKLKFAHDFDDTLQLAYTFGAWHNDAERRADTWMRDANGTPIYSGTVNIDGRSYALAPTDMGPSSQVLTHFMHGLSLRKRRAGNWDFEAAASLYDYDETRRAPRWWRCPRPRAVARGESPINPAPAGRRWRCAPAGMATRPAAATWSNWAAGTIVQTAHRDLRHRRLARWRRRRARLAFRGQTSLTSAFAQDSWQLAREWQATVGLRLEHWRAEDGALSNATQTLPFDSRSGTWWSPKLALSWAATPITTLKRRWVAPCACPPCPSCTRVRSRRATSSTTIPTSPPSVPGPPNSRPSTTSTTATCAPRCSSRTRATRCTRR
jgi:iron complex outermembrane receptor protein